MTPLVVNTRPREQSAELSRLLAAAGFDVLEAAAIETLSAWDDAELAAVRRDLAAGAYAWVVLPSQNAGRELVDELAQARVVCGAASAQALGLQPTHGLGRFSARAALEVLRPLVQVGQRILVPRAFETREELIDGLLALGVEVHAPVAYRTVPVDPSALAEAVSRLQRRDVVTVCSPSAIHSLVAAVGCEVLAQTRVVCLGETTARAAGQVGLRVDGVARHTTMASLVEAVLAVEASGVPV